MLVSLILYCYCTFFVTTQILLWTGPMMLSFFIWYSRDPPAAGRKGGEERGGGHPRTPGQGTASPGTPAVLFRVCGEKGEKEAEEHPQVPRQRA